MVFVCTHCSLISLELWNMGSAHGCFSLSLAVGLGMFLQKMLLLCNTLVAFSVNCDTI